MTRRKNVLKIPANQLHAVREVWTVILPVAAMDSVFKSELEKAAVTTPMSPYPILSVIKYSKKFNITSTILLL